MAQIINDYLDKLLTEGHIWGAALRSQPVGMALPD